MTKLVLNNEMEKKNDETGKQREKQNVYKNNKNNFDSKTDLRPICLLLTRCYLKKYGLITTLRQSSFKIIFNESHCKKSLNKKVKETSNLS